MVGAAAGAAVEVPRVQKIRAIEPEFQNVDHLPQGHARDMFREGLRLVGVDPNKATLMQCCEILTWVDETQPEECGKRHPTTWLRVT